MVSLPLAYLGYTAYLSGFPLGRVSAAAFVALWFGLAVLDWVSEHKLLDWLYLDEDDQKADGFPQLDSVPTPAAGDDRLVRDLHLVDGYLEKWDRFAQGENQLIPQLRDNKAGFESALAGLLVAGDKRASARMVFYPVVQVGGSIPVDSELGKACAVVLGSDFPVTTTKEGQRVYFGGDLYLWWEANRETFEAFPLLDEWSKREFAQTVVIPMFRSAAKAE